MFRIISQCDTLLDSWLPDWDLLRIEMIATELCLAILMDVLVTFLSKQISNPVYKLRKLHRKSLHALPKITLLYDAKYVTSYLMVLRRWIKLIYAFEAFFPDVYVFPIT